MFDKKKYKLMLIMIIMLVFIVFFSFINYESYDESSLELELNKPYILVIKELAAKESLEKTIEENDAKLIHKEWESFTVEIPNRIIRIRQYKIIGKLHFTIEKKLQLEKIILSFEQNINMNKDVFQIDTKLKEKQKNVLVLNKFIKIIPVENKTKLIIKSEIKIRKFIPFFVRNLMDKKVKEHNKKDLEELKKKLLGIINSKPNIKFEKIKFD